MKLDGDGARVSAVCTAEQQQPIDSVCSITSSSPEKAAFSINSYDDVGKGNALPDPSEVAEGCEDDEDYAPDAQSRREDSPLDVRSKEERKWWGRKKQKTEEGRIKTLADLDGEPEGSSPGEEYDAGAEQSGMLLRDSAKRKHVGRIFGQAQHLGPQQRPVKSAHPSGSQKLIGRGRLLSGEIVPADPQNEQSENVTQNMTNWTNAYSVADWPLRRFDDRELLQRALELSGNDLDSTIRSLNDLHIRQIQETVEPLASNPVSDIDGPEALEGTVANADSSVCAVGVENVQASGADWVELFVREVKHSLNIEEARARVSKTLQALEQSIMDRDSLNTDEGSHKENMALKERVEVLKRENSILKKAVVIQHERQKEHDQSNKELERLKNLVAEYQEQLRKLEINNYALMMRLQQAQQGSSIHGRFPPDVLYTNKSTSRN